MPSSGTLRKSGLVNTAGFASDPGFSFDDVRLPVRAGGSIGGLCSTATAGLVVTPPGEPTRRYLLVSSHIVGTAGDRRMLYSPGYKDRRNRVRAVIGEVERLASLDGNGPFLLDCAAVRVCQPGSVSLLHPLVGRLKGHYRVVQPGWKLVKCSRTSGPGEGVVVQTNWSGFVRYPDRQRLFRRVIVIHNPRGAIALDGDSGAVWVSEDGVAAAMAFSGSEDGHYSFAAPMETVLAALGMRVAIPAE